jgi:hypothetical protein
MLYAEYEYPNFAYGGNMNLGAKDPQHPKISFHLFDGFPRTPSAFLEK